MVIWKRLFFVLVLLALAVPAQGTSAAWPDSTESFRARSPKKIVVDLSDQRVEAYQGSVVVMRFPVSTGRNGNTAVGSFRIRDKKLAPRHARWGYRMPNWMGVYYVGREWENGFHALPVTEDGRELWADQIGTPASDGCIVLRPEDMRKLYEWAEVGTPVEIVE